jgi:hypothetical protein
MGYGLSKSRLGHCRKDIKRDLESP